MAARPCARPCTGLTPLQSGSRTLVLRDLAIVNNCAAANHRGPNLTLVSQTLLGLFSLSTVARSVTQQAVTVYVRHAELMYLMYLGAIQRISAWDEGESAAQHPCLRARCLRDLCGFFQPPKQSVAK